MKRRREDPCAPVRIGASEELTAWIESIRRELVFQSIYKHFNFSIVPRVLMINE